MSQYITPTYGKISSYVIKNSAIATVKLDSNGCLLVSPKQPGYSSIVVYDSSSQPVELHIFVKKLEDATSLKIQKKILLKVGKKKKVPVKLNKRHEALSGLRWSTSNVKIASVTATGVIYGKKKGKCIATCQLSNGKKYTVKIIVK